ncbi:MAG: hypothetical protein WBD58_06320 [Geitlerinemataceae cyanobacterium]
MTRFLFDLRRQSIRRILVGILSLTCLVLTIAFPRVPATAQITQAIVQEILDKGEVFVQDEKATLQQVAAFNEVVATKDESRTALLFSNLAAGRLAPNSIVTVGQCVEVQEGQLVASGPVNGCLGGFVADVQGTIYVMDADDGGKFQVLEGTVKVEKGNETVEVGQGEQVAVEGGILGEVKKISFQDFVKILKGALFDGFTIPLPNEEKLIGICQELRQDALGGTEGQIVGSVLGVPECPTELGVRVRPPIRLPF